MSSELDYLHCETPVSGSNQRGSQGVARTSRRKEVLTPAGPRWPTRAGTARSGKMSTGVIILICVACCLPLICCAGIGLPAIQAAREAARQAACSNNLKQIGLALHIYHSAHDCFPPAFIPDEEGRPMHSWRVLILPFLGQQALYEQYRMDEPWNSPHNSALATLMPDIYQCPSSPVAGNTNTSYVMVAGPNAFSTGPGARQVFDIADELSATVAVVEMADSGINWMELRDWDTASPDQPRSYHPRVFNALLADGSFLRVEQEIKPELLKAMTTIDGGEDVEPHRVEFGR